MMQSDALLTSIKQILNDSKEKNSKFNMLSSFRVSINK